MADKIIRSHRDRVKQANEKIGEHVSIFAREAYVREAYAKVYLLEDIWRVYAYRQKNAPTDIQFETIVHVLNAAIDVARVVIIVGDYKKVCRAIHERKFIAVAINVRKLPKLRKLATETLRELTADMDDAALIEEVENTIRVAEEAIPDKKS